MTGGGRVSIVTAAKVAFYLIVAVGVLVYLWGLYESRGEWRVEAAGAPRIESAGAGAGAAQSDDGGARGDDLPAHPWERATIDLGAEDDSPDPGIEKAADRLVDGAGLRRQDRGGESEHRASWLLEDTPDRGR